LEGKIGTKNIVFLGTVRKKSLLVIVISTRNGLQIENTPTDGLLNICIRSDILAYEFDLQTLCLHQLEGELDGMKHEIFLDLSLRLFDRASHFC